MVEYPIKTRNVYLLRGLPGSGKSTLARSIQQSVGVASFQYCSADQYFIDLVTGEYKFDSSKLEDAHKYCRNLFDKGIREQYSHILVDNTNILKKHYEYYYKTAIESDYKVFIYTVGHFDEDSVQQYFERGTHNVPLETIQRMARQFEL